MSENLIRRWNHHRLDWMRAQKLRLMKLIFDSISRGGEASAKEILVLRLDDKLGDSVTATGFLRELKKAFPDRKLTVLAGPLTAQIYQKQPGIDRVLISKKGLLRTLKIFNVLKKTSYEVIVNTSHIMNPRTIFLMSQLKAHRKLGFRCAEYSLFTDHVEYDARLDHVTRRYENTLKVLGVEKTDLDYEIHIPTELLSEAKQALQQLKVSLKVQKIVILNSYAGARLRSLNEKTSRALVEGILQQDPSVAVVSIGNHNDLPVIAQWIAKAALPRWTCFAGKVDFFWGCALIAQADLVISPDTAIVHIASALKRPQVAIFREDDGGVGAEQNAKIWAPLAFGANAPSRVVIAPHRYRSAGTEPDINDVNVNEVVSAAMMLLEK